MAQLESKEVGTIHKKKEPECTAIRSSSRKINSLTLYQIETRNFKRFCFLKNILIGILIGIISLFTIMKYREPQLVVIWMIGVTTAVAYALNEIDKGANYLKGGRLKWK